MKLNFLVPALSILLFVQALAQAQEIDKELSDLAQKLSVEIKARGNKKVTVLDFTDLEGGTTELGRYIAEQLTVDLVMGKPTFSILDRANRKSILAEHNLTATGLVDPSTAKQLGKFAGVDALVLGTITAKKQGYSLTAKIITTDTAEIIGAEKAEFNPDETIQKLASREATPRESLSDVEPGSTSQQFNSLVITVDKITVRKDHCAVASLTFENKSSKNAVAVAVSHPNWIGPSRDINASLTASSGTQYAAFDLSLTGIYTMRNAPERLTSVAPGASLKASIIFQPKGNLADVPKSFTLTTELIVNYNYHASDYDKYRPASNSALPPNCNLQNAVFEVPVRQDFHRTQGGS